MSTAELPALTAGEVAAAVGGRLEAGQATDPIRGMSIDSRALSPGQLFFAIRGQRFDGHAFVAAALQQGACGVVVSETAAVPAPEASRPVAIRIVVDDTTRALQRLAHHIRRASGAQVVAITGSIGKTTTKELAAEVLAARYRVFRNPGNLNNHIGLPLSLLKLRARPQIAVVELGMSRAGEIDTLIMIAEPEVRVWTNVGEAHAEFFDSIEAIADAKAEIMNGATAESVLVANANDPRVMARARAFPGRVTTFGIETAAEVAATDVHDLGLDGSKAVVRTPVGTATLRSPLLGRGHLANVLASTAVALHFQIPLDTIVRRVAAFGPPRRRGEVLRLPGGVTLIDDSYNSSPAALRCALEAIREATPRGRRVAILGEMLELGPRSEVLHEECGRVAAAVGLDRLVTVGGRPAKALAAAAAAAGMTRASVRHVATSPAAADAAVELVRSGDLVLVKGSRGLRTDIVVERLKSEFT